MSAKPVNKPQAALQIVLLLLLLLILILLLLSSSSSSLMNTYKEEISKWLYICLACLNCRVLIIAFLWSQLILQTSILRAIELSMFLTELMYVLISFNCWLIRLRWGLKWNSLLGNLHINQILVDHSNNPGCVIFGDVWLWNIVNTDM